MTAFMNGRNNELVEMTEQLLKQLKSEAEEKGLQLSTTEEGKKVREQGNYLLQVPRRTGGEVLGMQQE